jgi:hypothetical protein
MQQINNINSHLIHTMTVKCINIFKILIYIYIYIYIHMLLCCYIFRPYKAILRQHLFRDSNSLYANDIVFPRYIVDVPSYFVIFLNCGCFYVILVVLFNVVRCVSSVAVRFLCL